MGLDEALVTSEQDWAAQEEVLAEPLAIDRYARVVTLILSKSLETGKNNSTRWEKKNVKIKMQHCILRGIINYCLADKA